MPFSQMFPRSFTATSILAHAPTLPGVYGVSNSARWITVAESDNLQQTLLDLCEDSLSLPDTDRPSGFVFEVCQRATRAERCHRLTQEYLPASIPRHNRRDHANLEPLP